MNYTKGKWKVRHPVNNDYTIYIGEYGKGIEQIAILIENKPNAEANAHLIAATPEMYEALLDFTMAYRRGLKGEQSKAYTKAMKALAKAEDKE